MAEAGPKTMVEPATAPPHGSAQPKRSRKNPQRRRSEQAKHVANAQITTPAGNGKNTRPPLNTVKTSPPKLEIRSKLTSPPTPATSKAARDVAIEPPGEVAIKQPANVKIETVTLAPAAIVTGGLVGCAASAAVLAGVGIWHGYAGSEFAILAARTAKLCFDNLAEEVISSLKAGTYSSEEAIDVLRQATLAYASTIPGGTAYVERIFREVTLVRQHRGAEVDKVLKDTHAALNTATRDGTSPDEMRLVVVKQLSKLSDFASKSLQDVVDRNPELKPAKDSALKSLRGSPSPKQPTVKLNMTVRSKQGG